VTRTIHLYDERRLMGTRPIAVCGHVGPATRDRARVTCKRCKRAAVKLA
jgi:hypothetical protein